MSDVENYSTEMQKEKMKEIPKIIDKIDCLKKPKKKKKKSRKRRKKRSKNSSNPQPKQYFGTWEFMTCKEKS